MNEFVGLLRSVRKLSLDITLVTHVTLASMEIAEGYYIQQWIGADPANKDRWRFIRAIQNRAPFTAMSPSDLQNGLEYFRDGRRSDGLGLADLLDGLAISLPLDKQWSEPWLQVTRSALEEDDSGEITVQTEGRSVRHASGDEHVIHHKQWIASAGRNEISVGIDIWRAKNDLFPNLTFLPRVEQDLRNLRRDWVRPATEQLRKLEVSIAAWKESRTALPLWHTKITGEYERREHGCEFTDLDGVVRVFELHARMTPGAGRLHFRLVTEDRTVRVAYIGMKIQ